MATAEGPWRTIAAHEGGVALSISSSKGDQWALAAALADSPSRFISSLAGGLESRIAGRFGIRSFVPCPVAAACSTGIYAVLATADLIESGQCARALAGAVDRSLTPLVIAGFTALGVLCGQTMPQAFGAATGFAPAEGAGVIALAADGPWRIAAGVRLGDAGHPTRFTDPSTLATCLEALWSACPDPDLIITHGTGTEQGDAYEREHLASGPWASTPRIACKPFIGHCLGASGAVELAAGLSAPVRRLWKISLGFGGHLGAIAVVRNGTPMPYGRK
jgi:3-oxoacyl-[acyl-carrier-protein] synthase II